MLTISYIIIDRMPAQHKYNKYDNKKRYSSSSSSSYHRKDKEHKNYHNDKWRKKSRSRSHSNHRHENKYKGSYQNTKDERRYNESKEYDNKRSDHYRRRDPQEDRRRNDDKKNVTRYTFTRNDDRDRGYHQYRKEQKRQKTLQSKRYASSSSKSISKSPKHNRDNSRFTQSKFTYTKRNENKSSNFQDKADKKENQQSKFKYHFKEKQDYKEQKNQNYFKETQPEKSSKYGEKVHRDNQDRFYPKPKFGVMRPPFPPPPPNTRKFHEDPPRKYQFQPRKDEYKRQQKQFIKKQQKRKEEREQKIQPKLEITQKPIIQPQFPKLTPVRRLNEVKKQLKNEIFMAEIPKQKVSRFEMVMNEAKSNLVLPNPPINFMTLDTFKNMNKFQIQTLDKRWANSLKQELQKPRDLKQLLQSLPEVTQQQRKESRLWTYLKQQRNEQQHNLKMKLEQLRLTNMGLSQMVRKLHVLQS